MQAIQEFMKAKRVDVVIDKGIYEKPSKTIYEHEVPILEDMYGVGNIRVYERPLHKLTHTRGRKYHMAPSGKTAEYQVIELDHDEEYSRLEEVWGRHDTIDVSWVERTFDRRERSTLAEFGEREYKGQKVMEEEEVDQPPEEEIELLKKSHKREKELMGFTNAKLRNECRQHKLAVDNKENKETLIRMILTAEFMPTGGFKTASSFD